MSETRKLRKAYGQPVRGDQFVGRVKLVEEMFHNLSVDRSNLSIVGLGRIGKSSIAYRLIDRLQENPRHLVVRIDLQQYSTAKAVLASIVQQIFDCHSEPLTSGSRPASPEEIDDIVETIRQLVSHLFRRDVFVFVFVDEFDNVVNLKKSELLCNILRSFVDGSGRGHFSLVTVSRRPVSELAITSLAVSNLAGILGHPFYVRPFLEEDVFLFMDRHDIRIDQIELLRVQGTIGRHPFFWGMLAYHLNITQDIQESIRRFGLERLEYYGWIERFVSSLRPSLLRSLCSFARGYRQADKLDVNYLDKYGLVSVEEALGNTLSYEFSHYLSEDKSGANASALWNQLEKKLRAVLAQFLDDKYGQEWRTDHELLRRIFRNYEKIEKRMDGAVNTFALHSDISPLHFCYPAQYWEIIRAHRAELESAIGDLRGWGEHFDKIVMARNPTAHNWLDQLSRDQISAAEKSMQFVFNGLSKYGGSDRR